MGNFGDKVVIFTEGLRIALADRPSTFVADTKQEEKTDNTVINETDVQGRTPQSEEGNQDELSAEEPIDRSLNLS